jgi:hypothetical protein
MALGAILIALLASKPPAVVVRKPATSPSPAPVAAVRILDGSVQRGRAERWTAADRDFRIAPGEGLRTSADGAALLTLPWMHIFVGEDTVMGLTPSAVLSATLERGRMQQRATTGDILKVVTTEGEVRGRGDVVLSRSDTAAETRVSALAGWFRVRSPRGTVSLEAGQGAVLSARAEPVVVDLPTSPTGLTPGNDPLYVPRGTAARLTWRGSARRYRVQVLSLDGEEVVLSREVEGATTEVPGRWLGTFQWRVSAIGESGLEGLASAPGFLCVVEK